LSKRFPWLPGALIGALVFGGLAVLTVMPSDAAFAA
tara:strand:- start:467 stop:574 length:108 start_codon:yes stop_codon:yes gene_type:complete